MSGFFVPHNLKSPLKGAESGLLAGLTAAVKDMYDIAGERCGGGNPDWLANTRPATSHATAVSRRFWRKMSHEFSYGVQSAG